MLAQRMRVFTKLAKAEPEEADRLLGAETKVRCVECGDALTVLERVVNGMEHCETCHQELHPVDPQEEERREREVAMQAMGVPPGYWHCTRADWHGKPPPEFHQFLEDPTGFWILYGPPGRGKTHLGIAAAYELRERFRSRWVDVPDLLATAKRDIQSASGRVYSLARCPLLVLDDLGAERGTDWEQSVIAEIVRHRTNHALPMICTTNLTPRQCHEVEPRLKSRLFCGHVTNMAALDDRRMEAR